VFGIVIEVNPVFANVDEFSVVRFMPAAKITLVRLVLPLKALEPILVTVFGMVMEVIPVMFWKALLPILVIPVLSVRLVIRVMFWNALALTCVASVIVMVVKLVGI
jgi:hypothetical protein